MDGKDKIIIITLLIVSEVLLVIPFFVVVIRYFLNKKDLWLRKRFGDSSMLVFSGFLLAAIWCLRYAVGYYGIVMNTKDEILLSKGEEIFNSIVHALQTFSMDEDYTEYILDGKAMVKEVFGEKYNWAGAYGLYASFLNVIAPVTGGAIIFEILASIFPKLKLCFYHLLGWKKKCYFSELNEASLAMMKSIQKEKAKRFRKPVMIFADAYLDDENEKSSELMLSAKACGAICVRDDLAHVPKNFWGKKEIYLIDENEVENLKTLSLLADKNYYKCLENAKVFLFVQTDAYVQVECQVRTILKEDRNAKPEALPHIYPIQWYRNMVSNLLRDIPLYEPLIGKRQRVDGSYDLNVTILGTGIIGIEMFLATYWFSQMLDCNTTINIVSKESEEEFWNKIDIVNPEIRDTTEEGNPILQCNQEGEFQKPYCHIHYVQCDVYSSEFISLMNQKGEKAISNADYIFVALGSDANNISATNSVCKHVRTRHLEEQDLYKTIITYVVYDSGLATTLNRQKKYYNEKNEADVYMQAVGSLDELYSVKNLFVNEYEERACAIHSAYMDVRKKKQPYDGAEKEELEADYKFWTNLARELHKSYKAFSAGCVEKSIFTCLDDNYWTERDAAIKRYKQFALEKIKAPLTVEKTAHIVKCHQLAWMEHRRWNAFLRIKGFRSTKLYEKYANADVTGSYKQMQLKLHPCLVECDQYGVRTKLGIGQIDNMTEFACIGKQEPDFLDELTAKLSALKLNDYDFKQYDYPSGDFPYWTVESIMKKYNATAEWIVEMCEKGKFTEAEKVEEEGDVYWRIPKLSINNNLLAKQGLKKKDEEEKNEGNVSTKSN